MGVRKHFLSNPWSKWFHSQHVPETAFEICCHTCPCPVGTLRGPERASGISQPLGVHIGLLLLAFEFTGEGGRFEGAETDRGMSWGSGPFMLLVSWPRPNECDTLGPQNSTHQGTHVCGHISLGSSQTLRGTPVTVPVEAKASRSRTPLGEGALCLVPLFVSLPKDTKSVCKCLRMLTQD